MRKAGMTMKQIGKQLRQCAYIMQEELLHHAIFVFPLVVLVVLAHLVQAFTYHGALLPFHVVYYQQFLFWKLDILVGVLLLSYLLFHSYGGKSNIVFFVMSCCLRLPMSV